MTPLVPLYPLFLKLEGEPVVVIGGGRMALEKARDLVGAGARVTVVAPTVDDAVKAMAREGSNPLRVVERAFEDADVEGARVVIAATDDTAVNRRVFDRAKAAGALVNVVDVPELCTFYTGGIVRRGPLTVVIGTHGASPSLARRVRLMLEAQLPHALAPLARVLGEMRPRLLARYPVFRARAALLDAFVARTIDDIDDDVTDDEVRARIERELLSDAETSEAS
jgi:uroporphyrin-III C-methyltransferase/precorrin-2 dehydrogenase/sirohydrochlorin ferrochelatase